MQSPSPSPDATRQGASALPAAPIQPAVDAFEPGTPRPAPRSPGDLFVSFTWLAMQGFGGVVAIVQREIVERKRWLTQEEFLEDWAVAQVMPGPNAVNLAMMIGGRHFGLRGAMAALAGMMALPLLVVLALAVMYSHFSAQPQVAGALRGMGAVAGGLVAATGIRLCGALRKHPIGWLPSVGLVLLTVAAIAFWRVPLVYVLVGLGLPACLWTWKRLAP